MILRHIRMKKICQLFTKVGEQLKNELNGIKCLELSDIETPRKSIRSSRSFRPELSEFDDVAAALSLFATRATEKCRKQHTLCNTMTIFLHTNPFSHTRQYSNAITVGLHQGTNNTLEIIATSRHLLKQIFYKGIHYKKVGIILSDFSDESYQQQSLFEKKKITIKL